MVHQQTSIGSASVLCFQCSSNTSFKMLYQPLFWERFMHKAQTNIRIIAIDWYYDKYIGLLIFVCVLNIFKCSFCFFKLPIPTTSGRFFCLIRDYQQCGCSKLYRYKEGMIINLRTIYYNVALKAQHIVSIQHQINAKYPMRSFLYRIISIFCPTRPYDVLTFFMETIWTSSMWSNKLSCTVLKNICS